ncbi:MAG: hypothetical protein U5J83_04595 [Bryobacterales bacterium]|nr:hypothetical protein [Bryobacterales bacterium]
MRWDTNRRRLAATGVAAWLAAMLAVPLFAQPAARRTVRADLAPSSVPVRHESARSAAFAGASASAPVLAASLPDLGLVELAGTMYRIVGIPGGASLHPVQMPVRPGSSAAPALHAEAAALWVRAAPGETFFQYANAEDGDAARVEAAFPIGLVALSPNGTAMAIASAGDSRVQVFRASGATIEPLSNIDLGASLHRLAKLLISDDATRLLAVSAGQGWMEARVWSAATGTIVLAQGPQLRIALSGDGGRIAIFDAIADRLSVFEIRAAGIFLSSSRDLAALQQSPSPVLSELHFQEGRAVVTTIRERDVRLCGESGNCTAARLPIPAALSVRALHAANLLFVESARAGIPSYLLELTEDGAKWHFVSRDRETARGTALGRGPEGRRTAP